MNNWHDVLMRTSRTTALSVLSLHAPLRQSVSLGFLVLAALHEVDAFWPSSPVRRRRALRAFAALAQEPTSDRAREVVALAATPTRTAQSDSPSIVERLTELVDAIDALPSPDRQAIWHHAHRAAERHLAFFMRTRSDGQVVVRDEDELAGYCHMRLGIAAELATALIIAHEPHLAHVADELRAIASASAQSIGLVDYLDAEGAERSCPLCVRAPLERQAIVTMTEAGMRRAEHYLNVLRDAGAHRGVVAFAALPIAWARSRLDRVRWFETPGPVTSWLPPTGGRRRLSSSAT